MYFTIKILIAFKLRIKQHFYLQENHSKNYYTQYQ